MTVEELKLKIEVVDDKPNPTMKIGYKGMDKDMMCREVKFEVGKSYYIDENKNVKSTDVIVDHNYENNKLTLCSNEVFHYCDNLQDVFSHYNLNGSNRFFKIQILGAWFNESNNKKSGTTSFRILEELTGTLLDNELRISNREKLDSQLNLEELRNLQKEFPQLIIGGSMSLYLRGYHLDRFSAWSGDFDLISPYWFDLSESENIEIEEDGDKSDGNDFDDTFKFNGHRKVDLRVDPHQKYETITYKGEKYKVALMIDVIEAKARYAKEKGGRKHLEDLTELLSNNRMDYGNN